MVDPPLEAWWAISHPKWHPVPCEQCVSRAHPCEQLTDGLHQGLPKPRYQICDAKVEELRNQDYHIFKVGQGVAVPHCLQVQQAIVYHHAKLGGVWLGNQEARGCPRGLLMGDEVVVGKFLHLAPDLLGMWR